MAREALVVNAPGGAIGVMQVMARVSSANHAMFIKGIVAGVGITNVHSINLNGHELTVVTDNGRHMCKSDGRVEILNSPY